jgi:hypothetical protein
VSDTRYGSNNPCPVCQEQRDTKCSSKPPDAAHSLTLYRCRGTPSRPDDWCPLGTTDNGFKLYHSASDRERSTWRWSFDHDPGEVRRKKRPNKPVGGVAPGDPYDDPLPSSDPQTPAPAPAPVPPAAKQPAKQFDWESEVARCKAHLTDARLRELSAEIGLPPSDIHAAVPHLGYVPGNPISIDGVPSNDGYWTFPEADVVKTPTGLVFPTCGIKTRCRPGAGGAKGDKRSVPGSSGGLTIPPGVLEMAPSLPANFVEGATCAIAGFAIGLPCIGRSSNASDADKIARLVNYLKEDCTVVVWEENDGRVNAKGEFIWPGRKGAEDVAKKVVDLTDRKVFIVGPPPEYKDLRDWILALNRRDDITSAEQALKIVLDHIYGPKARAVEPSPRQPVRTVPNPSTAPHAKAGEGGRGESPAPTGNCPHGDTCGHSCCVRPFYTGPAGDADISPEEKARSCGSYQSPPDFSIETQEGSTASKKSGGDRQTRYDPNHPHYRETLEIIGPPPEFRPCRHLGTHPREGVHPSTEGMIDVLRFTCGKCRPCQDKIRYAEKLLHVSAALAGATHYWSGDDDGWQQFYDKLRELRKRLELKIGYSRTLRNDLGDRVTFVTIPADPRIPEDYLSLELGLKRVAPREAAERIARLIDGIPYRLPKGMGHIKSNETWRATGIRPAKKAGPVDVNSPQKSKMFADLGQQQLQCPDFKSTRQAAREEGAWTKEKMANHFRIAWRLLIGTDGDRDVFGRVFRRLFGVTPEMARLQRDIEKAKSLQRRERYLAEQRAMREADKSIKEMRARWAGREDEAGPFYQAFLRSKPPTSGEPPTGNAA